MDPMLLIKLVKDNWRVVLVMVVLAAAFGAGVTVESWRQSGVVEGLKRSHAEAMAAQAAGAVKMLTQAEKEQREERQRLAASFAAVDTAFNQERSNAQIQQDKLLGNLRDGVRRLSVAVTGLSTGGVPGTGPAASGTGLGDGATRAELDPAAAERIIRITNDGDDAIRQLMACQQLLHEERAK